MSESNGNAFEGNPFAGGIPNTSIFPPFAGGGIPAFIGNDTPTGNYPGGNNNQTTGNGNWYFNGGNQTTGNGNWYFGGSNQTTGNGNWYIGDGNAINGNGNRASGNDNSITGNGNRPTGTGNVITGNRFDTSDNNQTFFGNSDRYFVIDSNGQVSLMSNPNATPSDRTYDYSDVASSTNSGNQGGNSDLLQMFRDSPFGRLLDIPGIDGPEDIFGNLGGENPFGGGGGGGFGGGNPWAGWNPITDGNPFIDGDEPSNGGNPFGGGGNSSGNPFGGGENPFGGGGNPFEGGENPFGGGGNPFEGGGNPFEGDDIVISIPGDGYLLKDDEGKWYISSDETVDEDDQLLFGGGNPFGGGGNPFEGSGNPFEGDDIVLPVGGNGYLLKNDEGKWYLSNDEIVDADDRLLFNGSNPFTGSNSGGNSFEGENPFSGGGNPFAGGENPFTGNGNPFG